MRGCNYVRNCPSHAFQKRHDLAHCRFTTKLGTYLSILINNLNDLSSRSLRIVHDLRRRFTTRLVALRNQMSALRTRATRLQTRRFSARAGLQKRIFVRLNNNFTGNPVLTRQGDATTFPNDVRFVPPQQMNNIPSITAVDAGPNAAINSLT